MKKLIILLVAFVTFSNVLFSQALPSPKLPPFVLNPLPGYYTVNEVTYGFGLGDTNVDYAKYVAGFTTVHGYQINRYFLAGAGTGAFFYNGGFNMPLFLSGRFSYPVIDRQIVPYVNAEGGFLFNFDDFNGGTRIFVNPVLGARYTLSQTFAINLGVGPFIQMGPGTNRDTFINFKLGVLWLPKQ